MRGVAKCCLSCKFFRLVEAESGLCRVEKMADSDYPARHPDGSCGKWRDSGQQYFIRLGWLKARRADVPK